MATKIHPVIKVLNKYSYELKKKTRGKEVYTVRSSDRTKTQKEIEELLTKVKIFNYRKKDAALSGSTQVTVIDDTEVKNNQIILVFKAAAGGMQETTLNSTITELAPAIAFTQGITPKDYSDFYDKIKAIDPKKLNVYVNDKDRKSGIDFINNFPKSSKFKTKMENAIGVLNWLKSENKKNPIKNVIWGYRAKPANVDPKHKGDLFVEYKNGTMLGVSLKAGEEKSSEPKLNTYVNPILEKLDKSEVDKLRNKLYDDVYFKFSDSKEGYDKISKRQTINKLAELEKIDVKGYDELYDKGLTIIRNKLIEVFPKDVATTVKYLRQAITGQSGDVPLLVLKAFNTQVKILTDEDDVDVFLGKTKSIKCYASTTSKQDFFIELIGNNQTDKLVMKFSVRTNKTGDEHKLGQFFNLAVKFNGVK
jgi:hypothetical protein